MSSVYTIINLFDCVHGKNMCIKYVLCVVVCKTSHPVVISIQVSYAGYPNSQRTIMFHTNTLFMFAFSLGVTS